MESRETPEEVARTSGERLPRQTPMKTLEVSACGWQLPALQRISLPTRAGR
jgi:hypothetical protein